MPEQLTEQPPGQPVEELLRRYRELVAGLDAETERVALLHQERLRCRPGCASCCGPLSLLAVEAEAVARALAGLVPGVRQQAVLRAARVENLCPLLDQGLCLIYPSRPFICRTHGLPVGYVLPEEEAVEVSACPENFDDGYPFGIDELLLLDGWNGALAELNDEFCRATGRPARGRVAIADILREMA